MNVVVGIAETSGSESPEALKVLTHFGFPGPKVDLLHVIAPLVVTWFPKGVGGARRGGDEGALEGDGQ